MGRQHHRPLPGKPSGAAGHGWPRQVLALPRSGVTYRHAMQEAPITDSGNGRMWKARGCPPGKGYFWYVM
jgi:hypothetical protein